MEEPITVLRKAVFVKFFNGFERGVLGVRGASCNQLALLKGLLLGDIAFLIVMDHLALLILILELRLPLHLPIRPVRDPLANPLALFILQSSFFYFTGIIMAFNNLIPKGDGG